MEYIYVFMVLMSLSATASMIGARKRNSGQNFKLEPSGFEEFGVYLLNKELSIKCPDCAEWIKLEADVCKHCRAILKITNSDIRQEIENREAHLLEAEKDLARARIYRLVEFRRSIWPKVITISVVMVLSLNWGYQGYWKKDVLTRTKAPASARELLDTWEAYMYKCDFDAGEFNLQFDRNVLNPESRLGIDFDVPSADLRAKIDCFTNAAFGINFTDYWNGTYQFNNGDISQEIGNGYSMLLSWSSGGEVDDDWLVFYWRAGDMPN